MTDGKRKCTVNIAAIAMTAVTLAVLLTSSTKAEEGRFKSQGKIVFDNGTPDETDDVIFDAGDFNRLAYTCR
ncbi:MAG: hypothetical protein NC337_05480 [Roseburia sp.]|nr:hypothetical protein [Roseburia sp.]